MDYAINEMEQEVLNATREFAQKKLKRHCCVKLRQLKVKSQELKMMRELRP